MAVVTTVNKYTVTKHIMGYMGKVCRKGTGRTEQDRMTETTFGARDACGKESLTGKNWGLQRYCHGNDDEMTDTGGGCNL